MFPRFADKKSIFHIFNNNCSIKTLNLQSFREKNGYQKAIKKGFSGFASFYLSQFTDKTDANLSIYEQLVEIDSNMGTSESKQLFECLNATSRLDLIQVAQ